MIAELHRMGHVANADIALRGGDDLARLDAAAALDQLAVEARFLEIPDTVRDELRLINGHRDRIDRAAAFGFGSRRARSGVNCTTGNDGQRRASCDVHRHHAFSLSLPATFSSAFSTASPIC